MKICDTYEGFVPPLNPPTSKYAENGIRKVLMKGGPVVVTISRSAVRLRWPFLAWVLSGYSGFLPQCRYAC